MKELTEHSADAHHGLEDRVGEAGTKPQADAIRQAQPQGFVLGHEDQPGISVNLVFFQSPGSSQKPSLLLFPPQGMI